MRRRASIFGTLAAVTILALHPGPVCRAVNSARSFGRYFRDLHSAEASLSPVERVVFSLVLASTPPAPPPSPMDARHRPRT